ncbi:MAG: hypothetical protein ACI9UA_000188 [Pseudoalteromonas tetraodonis]|jgi:hypothetical protein
MDWIKQNTFLATYSGITLIGFLGLGFFAFSAWKSSSAAIGEFDSTRDTLDRLENAQLHPDTENLEKVKTEVDGYVASVDALMKKLEAAQKPLPTDVDVTKFGEKIQAELAPFQVRAKQLGVIMGDNFYMGMDKYRTETARNTEVLQKLEWSLGGISHLAKLTLDSEVDSVNAFKRFIEAWELEAVKPAEPVKKPRNNRRSNRNRDDKTASSKEAATVKTADVIEVSRIRMQVTGAPDSINELINKLSNDKEYFYWIRWAKIGNQTPAGPSRTKTYTPTRVDADAGVPAVVDDGSDEPPAFEEKRSAMIDVFPILGTEQVRADLLIDIVRFREPASPEKTSDNDN